MMVGRLESVAAVALCLVLALAAPAKGADTLSASPSVVQRSGDDITLSWTVSDPYETDFIAITVGGLSVGYFNVSQVRGWSTGSGSLAFPAVNMRTTYDFAYTREGEVVATSNTVSFANYNEPLQVHLALVSSMANAMRVMWTTMDNATDAQVQWGRASTHFEGTAAATADTYTIKDMCTAPANQTYAWMQPGHFFDAVMDELEPATRYYYRVGSNSGGWSDIMTFMSPAAIDASTETDIFAFGDLGTVLPWITDQEQQPPSAQTVHWVMRDFKALGDRPASVLHIGDISYARGWGYLWDSFMQLIQPASSQMPWMVGIGNHEYDFPSQPFKPSWADYGDDSGGECGVPYSKRFNMNGGEGHRNLWYSYDTGNVHVTVFSTEHDFVEGSPQWKWIESDLSQVNRSRTPWLIFTGHRPMYASTAGHDIGNGENVGHIDDHLKEAFEPMMVKYGVDMALWGHVHHYERMCGMVNFTCAESDNDAPVHLVIGMAGNVFQVNWAANLPESPKLQNSGHHVQPDWSIFRSGEFGYTRIHTNRTHLHLQYVGDQRGNVHDELWLSKEG